MFVHSLHALKGIRARHTGIRNRWNLRSSSAQTSASIRICDGRKLLSLSLLRAFIQRAFWWTKSDLCLMDFWRSNVGISIILRKKIFRQFLWREEWKDRRKDMGATKQMGLWSVSIVVYLGTISVPRSGSSRIQKLLTLGDHFFTPSKPIQYYKKGLILSSRYFICECTLRCKPKRNGRYAASAVH